MENATRYESDYQNAETRSRDRLREAKQRYSLTYQFGYDGDEDAARYVRERDRYVESELPQYEARIAEQRAMAEHELVENFIHRLREQIEDARQQLGYLNTTLSVLRFGGERFEFISRPEPSLRQVYDMIMDSQAILGESLFESGFRQRHQAGWDLLFERLTAGPDEALTELRELQDYRNYLQYDIRIHYPSGDRALLSQINAKKSGGETTTPFYVAMAASFAQAYRLNQPRPSDYHPPGPLRRGFWQNGHWPHRQRFAVYGRQPASGSPGHPPRQSRRIITPRQLRPHRRPPEQPRLCHRD
ncbi:MAG: hypothetical protein HC875_12315 [Anaerolineales bacterium]|nr:hypothetical protein [Anaerolineales bacterium]